MTFTQYLRSIHLFDRRKEQRPSQCIVDATAKHRRQTEAILHQSEELQKLLRTSKEK